MAEFAERYFASGRAVEDERDRLERLAAFYAEPTQRWLERAVVFRPGMRIMEAGAGSGAMLSWFARKVGESGDVLGLDIDLSHAGRAEPPVRLLEADLYAPPAEPERFDLVFARLVIEHLPDPARAIACLARWLRPGGVMALADIDCSVAAPADKQVAGADDFDAALDRVRSAMDRSGLVQADFGSRLPGLMRDAGLDDVREDRFERIVEGGSAWAEFMAENNLIIGALLGEADAARTVAAFMRRPGFRFHDQALVRVTGRKA